MGKISGFRASETEVIGGAVFWFKRPFDGAGITAVDQKTRDAVTKGTVLAQLRRTIVGKPGRALAGRGRRTTMQPGDWIRFRTGA